MSKYYRYVLAKLCCGVLPLRVDTCGFSSIALDERICEFCQLNEVEDELHFICKCTMYNDLRQNLYDTVQTQFEEFYRLTDEEKFIYLLRYKQCPTARFCWSAFNIRRQTLFGR